ncbi:MAG TPA: hypothetical protein VGQ21_09825 [Thermoanaerobaculia bacterium]|jgi:hypothetical protein|nr:hypothetical protein [Thermoanaerobaculia bacterium]
MLRIQSRACCSLFAVMLLACAAFASGWGLGKAVWVHPTKQQSEFQRDYNECQQKAAQNAANWGMKGNIFSIASDTNQCLTDTGWQRVKESDLRAMQQSPVYVIEWQTKLASVARANRGEGAAAVPLTATPEGTFADDFVEISGTLATYGNEGTVEVTNKTDSSARVTWDDASFVNLGLAARLVHSGVEFSEKAKPQLPSIIASKSRIRQVVMPVEAIQQMRGSWMRVSLFPKEETFDRTTGRAVLLDGMTLATVDANVAGRLVGKDVRILLPIDVGGVVREYTLLFTITGTRVRQTTQADLEKEIVLARAAL